MDAGETLQLIDRIRGLRVAIVGDYFLDEYVHGDVRGVSPEMPVLRMTERSRIYQPGAAGNLAANFAGLGAKVFVIGAIGPDPASTTLVHHLEEAGVMTGHLVEDRARITDCITRFVVQAAGSSHHQLRLDSLNTRSASAATRERLVAAVASLAPSLNALFISDYDETSPATGILRDAAFRRALVAAARNGGKARIFGSSRIHLAELEGLDCVISNDVEVMRMAESADLASDPSEPDFPRRERERVGTGALLVTLGKHGAVYSDGGAPVRVPAVPVAVVDPCGAGDAFAAAFTLAGIAGATPREAMELAGLAASVVIGKPGTHPISAPELRTSLAHRAIDNPKLKSLAELKQIMAELGGRTVVFTNGFFDLFHSGHVQFLRQARASGDVLIVGINSDRSTTANKGEGRPVLSATDRIHILGALECVDYVTVFDELTPINLIRELRPGVLVKGGNFTPDEVVGKDLVEAAGGRVVVIRTSGYPSTSSLIRSIKKASDGLRNDG